MRVRLAIPSSCLWQLVRAAEEFVVVRFVVVGFVVEFLYKLGIHNLYNLTPLYSKNIGIY